ncbi:hypothetical protein EG856_01980 [Mycoplasmopsis phocirhinis]|uniref:Uncharacterized protein n=1 Tax=Mycoplasmopsis phocirhinis TaxID=142650 RepID=A0A4P6MNS1_9BACT|nr:hypothetical protein [Mycoplasmopsis phocirhinis]QBF34683.1 hypothetical protein EG856_01980 [Mycoplasmopsis phocirhinis]
MNTNTTKWNTFRNVAEIIVTSSKDTSKINFRYQTLTKVLRRIYMLTIFIVYFTSLSAIAADKNLIQNYKFIGFLFGLNDLLVIIVAIVDFGLWFLISFKGEKPLLNLIKFPFSFMGILLIVIMLPSINLLLIYTGISTTNISSLRYLVLVRVIRLFFYFLTLNLLLPYLEFLKRKS